jgi:hypothetical protein
MGKKTVAFNDAGIGSLPMIVAAPAAGRVG